MIACNAPSPARKAQIRRLVRDQIIAALEEELGGGESIMKEVWEEMETDQEHTEANAELKVVIKILQRL